MFAADQMIRKLSIKIGEVDSGSARLLATHSNLAEPESTSPILMLNFLIIWSLLKGVKIVIHPSLALLAKKCQLASLLTDPHMMTLAGDDRCQYSIYTLLN